MNEVRVGEKFPIVNFAGLGVRSADPAAVPGPGPLRAKSEQRILIVEDEALIAWNLQTVIEGFGYTVCGTAATGARAIKLAEEEQPDLILMDIRLADSISGLQAAEAILRSRHVPIVFVTAFSDAQTAQRVASLGAQCLSKPVAPHVLGEVLERLTGPAG